MNFKIIYKYAFINILKSRIFLYTSIFLTSVLLLLNLSWGLYIKINQTATTNLFTLNLINTVLLFMCASIIGIYFSYEFIFVHKNNGLKTIEIKNGVKIWQIFCAKNLVIVTFNVATVFILSTIINLLMLAIFKDNTFVIKLIFINLYLTFFIILFNLSISVLLVTLNLQKISLIFMGCLTGLLSLFSILNSVIYDFTDYGTEYRGNNKIDTNNYRVYYNYYVQNLKSEVGSDNEFINELYDYATEVIGTSNLLYIDDSDTLDSDLKNYYYDLTNDNTTIFDSGNLFYNVELINEFNKQIFIDETNYREIKINGDFTNTLVDSISGFDIDKSNLDILANTSLVEEPYSLIKELENYIEKLELYFKNSGELSSYYNEMKTFNSVILEIYKKTLYFSSIEYSLSLGSLDSFYAVNNYVKDEFTAMGSNSVQIRNFIFNLRKTSSGKMMYQNLLFYIASNFGLDNLVLTSNTDRPSISLPTPWSLFNYYTSPFLWVEFMSKYGFTPKTFSNMVPIDSYVWYFSNNLFEVPYEKYESSDFENYYKINGYYYKGPNTVALSFVIILEILLIFAASYYFYRINFYK